jgi:hypothetical protein
MVIAIDFDGTITEQSFPEVGALKKDADVYIRKLWSEGHAIVINTCRSGKYEGMAEDFLRANDIPFSYINSNMPHLIVDYGQDCRKISADVYIDDRCLMGLPDTWEEIYNMVQKINQKKIV